MQNGFYMYTGNCLCRNNVFRIKNLLNSKLVPFDSNISGAQFLCFNDVTNYDKH